MQYSVMAVESKTATFSLCPHVTSSLCTHGKRQISGVSFSFYENSSPVEVEPYLMSSCKLYHLFIIPISKYSLTGD
jgi:hypothetical protein